MPLVRPNTWSRPSPQAQSALGLHASGLVRVVNNEAPHYLCWISAPQKKDPLKPHDGLEWGAQCAGR